jgi:hypothetical protein
MRKIAPSNSLLRIVMISLVLLRRGGVGVACLGTDGLTYLWIDALFMNFGGVREGRGLIKESRLHYYVLAYFISSLFFLLHLLALACMLLRKSRANQSISWCCTFFFGFLT